MRAIVSIPIFFRVLRVLLRLKPEVAFIMARVLLKLGLVIVLKLWRGGSEFVYEPVIGLGKKVMKSDVCVDVHFLTTELRKCVQNVQWKGHVWVRLKMCITAPRLEVSWIDDRKWLIV